MSQPLAHPSVSSVKAIHAEVLAAHGGSASVRDEALLESAVAAPRATMMGRPLLSDPIEVAAAYLFYLCQNHPFVDGNKRTALATCLVFLSENGLLPEEDLETDAWEKLVLDVASRHLGREQIAKRLRKLLSQRPDAEMGQEQAAKGQHPRE
jgi:death on curing protein